MSMCDNYITNWCEPINYCSTVNDYRPMQSTLFTRFGTTDCSDVWRTTNQDYGAFYYRPASPYCTPDNLKTKVYRRHSRFQDWMSYQAKHQHLCASLPKYSTNDSMNQTVFPPARNDTVRVTHRRRFLPSCTEQNCAYDKLCNQNSFSPCGEDGLITEYIVRKVLQELRQIISPDEYCDVAECAQLLVSEILSQNPSLYTNEIIDRVVTIMTTPLDCNAQSSNCTPYYSNVSTKLICCTNSQPSTDNYQVKTQVPSVNVRPSSCLTINPSVSFNNCHETKTALSDAFEELNNLENTISMVSDRFMKS